MAKSDKKAEKKDTKAKTEVKAKVGKKVKITDAKKPVSAIPSAKHAAPISSKEILARVCAHYIILKKTKLIPTHWKAQRENNKKSKKDESSEASSESSSEDEKPTVKPPVTNGKVRTTSDL